MTTTKATDRKCTYRRCQDGVVYGRSDQVPWACMRCNGTGRIPSAADCRAAESEGRRRAALITTLRARARARGVDDEVHVARDLLETNERPRHLKMLDAIEAGRVDAVIDALIRYYHASV